MELVTSTTPAQEAGRILSTIEHDERTRLEPELEQLRAARRTRPRASAGDEERWDLIEGILERMCSPGGAPGESSDTCIRLLNHLSTAAAGAPGSQDCGCWPPPIRNAFLLPALTT